MAQDGSLYVVGDTCYLKYYTTKADGSRTHKTVELCKRSDKYDWWKKRGKWGFSSDTHDLQREKMDKIRAEAKAAEVALTQKPTPWEPRVVDVWEKAYPLTQVSVANHIATYFGTITGGENDAYKNKSFAVTEFSNPGNNGYFTILTSSATQFTVAATKQVNETHAGTAKNGYLPYIEAIVPLTRQPRRKQSTVRGFKQIWRQHLQGHFGTTILKDYEPAMGKRFLRSLTSTQGKTTLKHIKALAGSLFAYAVDEEFIKVNPWHDVKIPDDAVESEATKHYTLAEVEDLISALVDHVDAQLVLALACFLGLRPGEIAALRWEDFDFEEETVYIRRSVVRGIVSTPKTAESIAILPFADVAAVIIPLKLWYRQCSASSESGQAEGYVFESKNGTPLDLHNLTARVLRPHIEGPNYQLDGKGVKCIRCNKVPKASGVIWKTLYAGRRGAATAVIEKNNGNLAIGQALLRHKNQITTATFYKKAVSPQTLAAGVKKAFRGLNVSSTRRHVTKSRLPGAQRLLKAAATAK